MKTYCGYNCDECPSKESCKGCEATCGNPFGSHCIAAEAVRAGGESAFGALKATLLKEINAMKIPRMPEATELFCLVGAYVNLPYPLPSGESAKLLDDKRVYLGTQIEGADNGRCFGVVCDRDFILVVTYGENGADPKLLRYQAR